MDELGDRVADLGVPTRRRTRQIDVDTFWTADRVAMGIEASQREMTVVEIHPDHRTVAPNFAIRVLRGNVPESLAGMPRRQ